MPVLPLGQLGISATLYQQLPPALNDLYEYYDPEETPLPQRQQQNPGPPSQGRPPTSSAGSNRSLRRTPRLQEAYISSRRPISPRSPQRPGDTSPHKAAPSPTKTKNPAPAPVFDKSGSTTPQSFRRLVEQESYWPQRSNHISRRTHDAILFTLEAIRKGGGNGAKPLTTDVLEERARMSDLLRGDTLIASGGNGRPQNGGSRTAQGPAPPFADPQRAVRTPTQVMQERRAREARKRAQQEAEQRRREEESRIQQQEGEAVGVVGGQSSQRRPGNRVASGNQPQYAQNPGPPPSTYQQATIGGGGGQETISATNQPSRRNQIRSGEPGSVGSGQQGAYASGSLPAGTNPRRNPAENITNPAANPKVEPIGQATQQPQAATQQAGRASFPHAFERWETLSSHWEGLTSYWIRRIQENSNELDSKPIHQQMSRQITDLSAAGANLFHAVVELQRLRASSERKFQRWFFETRDEQERAREREAELERQLRTEQEERAKINTSSSAVAESAQAKAEELIREHRRELQISKEEARRAWEELGRREQEERERTIALRNGEPTVIGGVQVVPMQGIPSRQTSEAIRPTTRDGPYPGGPGPATMGGMQPAQQVPSRSQTTTTTTLDSPGDEQRQFTFRPEADSPTNTDPFTDTRRAGDPGAQYQSTPQRPTQLAASPAENVMRAATSGPSPARAYAQTSSAGTGGGTFYQQGMADTILRNPITTTAPSQTPLYPPARSGTADTNPSEQRSYIPSTVSGNGSSQGGEEEYEINPDGSYTRDAQGRRIPYGGGQPSRRQQQAPSDDGTDEYDVASDIERERQHSQRYGGGGTASSNLPRTTSGNIPQQQMTPQQQRQLYSPVTVPPPTQSLAAAASQFTQSSQAGPVSPVSPADYSGTGYGASGGGGSPGAGAGAAEWENPTASPHGYPTRLSDIIEERSGPTSPSRASYASATGAPEMPMPPVSSAYSRGR